MAPLNSLKGPPEITRFINHSLASKQIPFQKAQGIWSAMVLILFHMDSFMAHLTHEGAP